MHEPYRSLQLCGCTQWVLVLWRTYQMARECAWCMYFFQLWESFQWQPFAGLHLVYWRQKCTTILVGDSGYPLVKWLLKPFPLGEIYLQTKKINYRLSRAWIITEIAFGRLKATWHRLLKQYKMVSISCNCLLCIAQLCEIHGNAFNGDRLEWYHFRRKQ